MPRSRPSVPGRRTDRRGRRRGPQTRRGGRVRILAWHVHAAWMTSFVQGNHDDLVPVLPDRGPDGRGRAETYPWPSSVREVSPAELPETEIDVVVLQRPHEL